MWTHISLGSEVDQIAPGFLPLRSSFLRSKVVSNELASQLTRSNRILLAPNSSCHANSIISLSGKIRTYFGSLLSLLRLCVSSFIILVSSDLNGLEIPAYRGITL